MGTVCQANGDTGTLNFGINNKYKSDEFLKEFADCLEGRHENSVPFPHFSLDDFLFDSKSVEKLCQELKSAKWHKNHSDLANLWQTDDIEGFDVGKFPLLYAFRNFMQNAVKEWLEKATGVPLLEQITLTGSRYNDTHFLLPHDDRCDKRAFAFILYLMDPQLGWSMATQGGALQLHDTDAENCPRGIFKAIEPAFNSLVLFRVQQNSWHSVGEIFGKNSARISLNGWFLADERKWQNYSLPKAIALWPSKIRPLMDLEIAELEEWLNPNYLIENPEIQHLFEANSEILLTDILKSEKYEEILKELETGNFITVGPLNKRKFDLLNEENLPSGNILSRFLKLLRSNVFIQILNYWTGLDFGEAKRIDENFKKDNNEGPSPKKLKIEENFDKSSSSKNETTDEIASDIHLISSLSRFGHANYSMADDVLAEESSKNGHGLDVILFLGRCKKWPAKMRGGRLNYFVAGQKDLLLSIEPQMNSIAVVFREPEVLSFQEYINHKAGDDCFYSYNCSYIGIKNFDDLSDGPEEVDDEDNEIQDEEILSSGSEEIDEENENDESLEEENE